MKIQAPVKKGQTVIIQISAQGTEGEGIGRVDGFAIFVPSTVEGDTARVEITKVNHSYAFGRLVELIQPSVWRVQPPCPVFDRCGGCNFMHIAYEKQLELKRQRVADCLQRIGGFESVEVASTLGMQHPWRYRNKTQMPVGRDDGGRLRAGFFAPRSHEIVPVEDCQVGSEQSASACAAVLEYMNRCLVEPYDEKEHRGVVRHVFVRHSRHTGQVMVVVAANALRMEQSEVLVSLLRDRVIGLKSVIHNVNTERTNVVLGKHNVTLWGQDYIEDCMDGLRFRISPASFYQVNTQQTQVLYRTAVEFAQLTGHETVFDLYCGIGTISLYMAKHTEKVIGVELVEDAVKDARQNAVANGINHAYFYAGAVEQVIPRLYEMGERADVVVLDPPRKGVDRVTLQTVIDMNPERIVYVSCNPATLARDTKVLFDDGGYAVRRVQPVDMFAHTGHVETVALLSHEKEHNV